MAVEQHPGGPRAHALSLGLKPRQRLGLLLFTAGCLASGSLLWQFALAL